VDFATFTLPRQATPAGLPSSRENGSLSKRDQQTYSTQNVYGGYNYYPPSGGMTYSTQNVYGGYNYSNGGYSSRNVYGGYNYYGR